MEKLLYQIDFEPIGKRIICPEDMSLLDCGREAGIGIICVCGGQGKCHSCKVKILSGTVSELTPREEAAFSSQEIRNGWRLACQIFPVSDCKLGMPLESMTAPQRTQTEGAEISVPVEPNIFSYPLKLTYPSLLNTRSDADRILEALIQQHQLCCRTIDIDVLRNLSPRLRSWEWKCQASVRNGEVVSVNRLPSRQLGLAIDLGTTKIAGYLVDLTTGETLAAKAVMNPQISYGEDVITRIDRVIKSQDVSPLMQRLAAEGINQVAQELCISTDTEIDEIVDSVIVGNTVMHHLLLRLPVSQLAYAPFMLTVRDALNIKARDVGLDIFGGVYVHFLPNIAAFVGGDHVAVLLAIRALEVDGPLVVIDIGTNAEISLIENGEITSVSCASGPAFEGFHIKDGMRASRGAIEHLKITRDNVQYQTIDEAPPAGICGSGLLDAVAELYRIRVLDKNGRMCDDHRRICNHPDRREFVLVSEDERGGRSPIVITQLDIRELQLAKAAIRAGIQTVIELNGLEEEKIEQIIIAGAFGSYIDVTNAITIGMLPALPPQCFKPIGNAAGMGAKLALISSDERAKARDMASKVNYIELASKPRFKENFIQACSIGLYRISNGRREELN